MSAEENVMLSGPVGRVMIGMSAPIGASMLSTFLFQVVDTFFVGHLGADALAALGFASTVYFLLVSVLMGAGVGISALVARYVGARDQERAGRVATLGVFGNLIVMAAVAGSGWSSISPTFSALGAEPGVLGLIDAYMSVIYPGMILLSLGLAASAGLHAIGRMKEPAVVFGIAGGINAALDYVLIFGIDGLIPAFGFQGAALATVGSWVFVSIAMLVLLARFRLLSSPMRMFGATVTRDLRESVLMSVPAIAAQVLAPLTVMWLTFLVARTGQEAVAALGIAARVEALALVAISAVSVAVVPFVAQNVGAGERARVERVVVFVGKVSFYCGGLAAVALVGASAWIAGAFTDDASVQGYITRYYMIVAWSYVPLGLMTLTSSVLHGAGRPGLSLELLLVKALVVTAPLAMLGVIWGAEGVFVAMAIGNLVGALYARRIMAAVPEYASLMKASPIPDYRADVSSWIRHH